MKIEKINLETREENPVKKLSLGKKGKIFLEVFGVLFLLVLVMGIFMGISARSLLVEKGALQSNFDQTKQAVKEQDLVKIEVALGKTEETLKRVEIKIGRLGLVKILPILSNYVSDVQHGVKAGTAGLEGARLVVKALTPYADILGLSGARTSTESGKTTMDRITFVVTTLDKIKPQFDEIAQKMKTVKSELDNINPDRYPKNFRGKKIRDWIIAGRLAADQGASLLSDAKPLLEVLPSLLGVEGEKFYFVIFQNDGELRPTGGFMTAYGILRVDKGKITPVLSQDIYYLDSLIGKTEPAPEALVKYVRLPYQEEVKKGIKPHWRLRDMNLSPDFRLSMEKFYTYYQKVPVSRKINGVLAVDTKVLVELLKITGPVGVPEWGNFSAELDKRCDCPQVVYRLEELADKPVSSLNLSRKAVIGPLMHSVLLNAFQSPKAKMPLLVEAALKSIYEKHLLVYLFDERAQNAVEAFNLGGRIKDFEEDYLHLNDTSFSGAKSNLFIKQAFEQKIETASDGTITKTVTVNYKNPAPPSDCNIERGGLCLNAPYRNWVRLYVPKGSVLIETSGFETEIKTYEELGKTVFEGFYGDKYPLRPQSSAKVVFKYTLPFKVKKGEEFRLLIQKQPGVESYEYLIDFNGQKQEFELRTDKELKFKV